MQTTLKQATKLFLGAYTPDKSYRARQKKDEKRLAGRLPDIVHSLVETHGWCSFNQGMVWLCDPDDWTNVADVWLPAGQGRADIIARTSFGEFVAIRDEQYWLVLPNSAYRVGPSDDPNWIFGATLVRREYGDLSVLDHEHRRARKSAGEINYRQIFNFAPAIPLGGDRTNSEIAIEDMAVALDILSQLAPVTGLDN